jgi:hypothetical protein
MVGVKEVITLVRSNFFWLICRNSVYGCTPDWCKGKCVTFAAAAVIIMAKSPLHNLSLFETRSPGSWLALCLCLVCTWQSCVRVEHDADRYIWNCRPTYRRHILPPSSERNCSSETVVPAISLCGVLTQNTTLWRFIIYTSKKLNTWEDYKQSYVKYYLYYYEFTVIKTA